jgi:hypothetical protein
VIRGGPNGGIGDRADDPITFGSTGGDLANGHREQRMVRSRRPEAPGGGIGNARRLQWSKIEGPSQSGWRSFEAG